MRDTHSRFPSKPPSPAINAEPSHQNFQSERQTNTEVNDVTKCALEQKNIDELGKIENSATLIDAAETSPHKKFNDAFLNADNQTVADHIEKQNLDSQELSETHDIKQGNACGVRCPVFMLTYGWEF